MFEAVLRGVNFRPFEAKAIVNALEFGQALDLEREPENPHDANAIKVFWPGDGEGVLADRTFLGYVAKEIACEVAPLIDSGQIFDCFVGDRMSATVVTLSIVPHEPDDAAGDFDT